MLFTVWIGVAFLAGLAVSRAGLPPLVGFLLAGFGLRAAGVPPDGALDLIGELGVLLLLFVVGLKIRAGQLLRAEVLATAGLQFLLSATLCWLAALLLGLPGPAALLLGAAAAFSSTVIAAKILESRRELRAFHGRVTIGILIVQDLLAVGVLALLGAEQPSPAAALLLLLPLLRPLLLRLLDGIGHGELLVLYGVVLALAIGGYGFQVVGLSPELGALLLGALLAGHPKSKELADSLWSVKEFLLVGFFLGIGLQAVPDAATLLAALALVGLLWFKAAIVFLLLLWFGLRPRTAFMAAVTLSSYSEFGLIVIQAAVERQLLDGDWLVLSATAVAMSFALAAPLSRHAHALYRRYAQWLDRFENAARIHPDDQPLSLGDAAFVIAGMGRIGTAAYDCLQARGARVVGLDNDPAKLAAHEAARRRVVFADAEDPGFWQRLDARPVRAVLLALPDLDAKTLAAEQLRAAGFQGLITAVHTHSDEVPRIRAAGADASFDNAAEAGIGFATDTWQKLAREEPASPG
ncbi:MAG: hypothetical protein D6727_10095 [Gammaproteobacteria bacterium]|nr:MAG: hypothetical protein D6727_10095 [Gammaproteobacteria bacterium]